LERESVITTWIMRCERWHALRYTLRSLFWLESRILTNTVGRTMCTGTHHFRLLPRSEQSRAEQMTSTSSTARTLRDIPTTLLLTLIFSSLARQYVFIAYWLRAGRPRGRSSSPGTVKNILHVVQTGSGAHTASYRMGTRGSFPRGKAAEA
jgi:hypothetical protein